MYLLAHADPGITLQEYQDLKRQNEVLHHMIEDVREGAKQIKKQKTDQDLEIAKLQGTVKQCEWS